MFDLDKLPRPTGLGSYKPDDVIFLLKDLSYQMEEKLTSEREQLIQGGTHYSEMLPLEQELSEEYYNLFYKSMEKYKKDLVAYIAILCQKVMNRPNNKLVLVSLARAGTPIGVLMKRFIQLHYNVTIPHYSISIIIGKGFDENALKYILGTHPDRTIQFVDGWTGKGTIKRVLTQGCNLFNSQYNTSIEGTLAVLADPCGCAEYYGTTKDFLIPSSLLNSTVSGLLSRTIHRDDLVAISDFHGAKYYAKNLKEDVSNYFVDEVSQYFHKESPLSTVAQQTQNMIELTWNGLSDVKKIQSDFNIQNINHIKPGVGETTRVLLRRVPWKILVENFDDEDLLHILKLAKEKNVAVEKFPLTNYRCCGIIKNLGES